MGANRWRDEQEWPLARARPPLLSQQQRAREHSCGGWNARAGNLHAGASVDHFVYDPSHPVPTGAQGGYSRTPSDQRDTEKREDVLVYSTPPLREAIEVTGPISVKLWVASSARDTDFTAKLVDVFPDRNSARAQ